MNHLPNTEISQADRMQHAVARGHGVSGAVWTALLALLAFVTLALANVTTAYAGSVTLKVVSARAEPKAFGGAGVAKGAAISEYKFLINVDNTGTTEQRSPAVGTGCNTGDAGYPGSCKWTSIAGAASNSPVYTQGDQVDATTLQVPAGRYLISVMAAGYKLDGRHFKVAADGVVSWEGKAATDPAAEVRVELQPTPLPDATIRAFVFADISPTNSAPDLPAESGLAGFVGHITDTLGEVTTDVYGNPLCTLYVGENPVTRTGGDTNQPIPGTGGSCVSGADGYLVIPHLGPNRYALSVTPPDGSGWIQTTTLEGNHDWDAWVMEGATGLDTEFVIAGEPFPAIIFGYVRATTVPLTGTGTITGVVDGVKIYVPTTGGVGGLPGQIWGGMQGAVIDKPIPNPWVTLADLGNGDTMIWAGQGDADGRFTIPNVPAGNYTLTWWDEPQNTILDLVNLTVGDGETVDMGILPLAGWWTLFDGYVFNDLNRNGVRDAGEPGLPGYTLTMRRRDNSLMDRGTTATTTDALGYYKFEAAYPMTQWLVMEAYDNLHYTTGVTYQADNQPEPTTVLGAGVDVSVLPIIGLAGRMDWGKHVYDATGASGGLDPRNGGIVGTVSYDTTRNELDPRYAAAEDWQPSISGLKVNLNAPVFCGTNATAPCDATGRYELAADGSFAKGPLLNTYLTETWERPTGCTARGADKQPLVHGTDEQVLPLDADAPCIEGPLMGVQFGTYPTPDGNFGAAVDGNYGFGEGCFVTTTPVVYGVFDPATETCTNGSRLQALPGGRDYLVTVDLSSLADSQGRPIYKVTREEDINIANGDEFIPAALPSECAGPLHTVDSTGNATFLDMGGSPYEGQQRPLCDTKLVRLSNGSSIAPSFNLFTDVPLPGRHWFIIIDDLNFSTNAQSITMGEKAGMPFVPVGVYDWTDRLVTTVEADYNGLADVLLPSTNRINCPTPSGVCANVYRYVGNDPGVPGRLNLNYNPTYRTIAAEFEVLPGQIIPADLAPTQVGVTVQLPGAQNTSPIMCTLDNTTPQLYAVSQPFVNSSTRDIVISGAGFGAGGTLTLGGTALATSAWSDSQITVTVPVGHPTGTQQLMITRSDNGQHLVNGMTIHVLGTGGTTATFPILAVSDTFNRANANTLGTNWQQTSLFGIASIRVNSNQASCLASLCALGANAHWSANLSATQAAAFTFANTTLIGNALYLKGTTLTAGTYVNAIRVRYSGSQVVVETTNNAGISATLVQAFPASFVVGDRLTAMADASGNVYVWKTTAASVTTFLGQTSTSFIGTGRAGMRLMPGARVDDFRAGNTTAPVTSGEYNPAVFEVGPGKPYAPAETLPVTADHAIQRALDAAASYVSTSNANSNQGALVIVYPNDPTANSRQNPRGAYYENLIITSKVKLQGVGVGSPDGVIRGSIIDGGAFAGDSPVATDWYTRILQETTLNAAGEAVPTWGGNPVINDGAVISVYVPEPAPVGASCNAAACRKAFPVAPGANTAPSIDGFDLRGGDQAGFPGNINVIGGTPTGLPGGLTTQGGAVFANAYARNLRITNNVVQNNGGAYGAIRIGTPDLAAPYTDSENDGIVIANNRVVSNAGTNLAGGIGIFAGANGYQVAANDICGNFSSEYGGGISHVGLSPAGVIRDNRIYFNKSFDEGGGVMIAGALPAFTTQLSPGSGAVDIYNNIIQANLSNDDGGGIRFLMAGNYPMNVYNNFIVNNVSTHEGGGISLNDAPDVRVFNNTIMKNLTTATAITSNGAAAPAGLASSQNSALLQATLPVGSPIFSNPVVFNNIFWDNRAGTRALTTVTGLGSDATPIDLWDLGLADNSGVLAPTNSIIQQANTPGRSYVESTTNSAADPQVVQTIDIPVTFNTWRNNPAFLGAILISADLPPNLLSDYHLTAVSPAANLGATSNGSVNAPAFDLDNEVRPANGGIDAGADEFGSTPFTPATVPTGNGAVAFSAASAGNLNGSTLNLGNVAGAYNLVTITLSVSGAPVNFGAVTVRNNDGSRFSEVAGGTCQDATVAAGGTCTVLVNFNANGNDHRRASLSVAYGGASSPFRLNLAGR
ncbi:MAG: hypothetical protein IPJ08_16090 [Burkholderiales bacterium]|nr:hypothetical protein [Burkholderiales bacterium]